MPPVDRKSALAPSLAITFLTIASLTCLAGSAHAIDCSRAKQAIERLICDTPALKTADAAMNRAYLRLLKSSPDGAMQRLVIASQRRWLAARDRQPDITAPTDDTDEREAEIAILLTEIASRRDSLMAKPDGHGKAPLVMQIESEKSFAAQFRGGRFGGYTTDCFFTPRPYGAGGYACTGTEAIQNGNRVCSSTIEWTSGRQFERRRVADIALGKPKIIATCDTNDGSGQQCPAADAPEPDDGAPDVGWDLNPTPDDEDADGDGVPASKFDADYPSSHRSDGSDWMQQCLTDANYPPNALKRSASPR